MGRGFPVDGEDNPEIFCQSGSHLHSVFSYMVSSLSSKFALTLA